MPRNLLTKIYLPTTDNAADINEFVNANCLPFAVDLIDSKFHYAVEIEKDARDNAAAYNVLATTVRKNLSFRIGQTGQYTLYQRHYNGVTNAEHLLAYAANYTEYARIAKTAAVELLRRRYCAAIRRAITNNRDYINLFTDREIMRVYYRILDRVIFNVSGGKVINAAFDNVHDLIVFLRNSDIDITELQIDYDKFAAIFGATLYAVETVRYKLTDNHYLDLDKNGNTVLFKTTDSGAAKRVQLFRKHIFNRSRIQFTTAAATVTNNRDYVHTTAAADSRNYYFNITPREYCDSYKIVGKYAVCTLYKSVYDMIYRIGNSAIRAKGRYATNHKSLDNYFNNAADNAADNELQITDSDSATAADINADYNTLSPLESVLFSESTGSDNNAAELAVDITDSTNGATAAAAVENNADILTAKSELLHALVDSGIKESTAEKFLKVVAIRDSELHLHDNDISFVDACKRADMVKRTFERVRVRGYNVIRDSLRADNDKNETKLYTQLMKSNGVRINPQNDDNINTPKFYIGLNPIDSATAAERAAERAANMQQFRDNAATAAAAAITERRAAIARERQNMKKRRMLRIRERRAANLTVNYATV